jgi:hypothetical protein
MKRESEHPNTIVKKRFKSSKDDSVNTSFSDLCADMWIHIFEHVDDCVPLFHTNKRLQSMIKTHGIKLCEKRGYSHLVSRQNNIHLLKWSMIQGCVWYDRSSRKAVYDGYVDVLKCVAAYGKIGYAQMDCLMYDAVRRGHVDICQWMIEMGFKTDYDQLSNHYCTCWPTGRCISTQWAILTIADEYYVKRRNLVDYRNIIEKAKQIIEIDIYLQDDKCYYSLYDSSQILIQCEKELKMIKWLEIQQP